MPGHNPSLLEFALRHHARLAAAAAVLMLLSAATESLGLVLLLPLLAAMGGDASGALGNVGNVLRGLGLLAIGPILSLFFFLVLLRAVVGHLRALAGLRLRIGLVDLLRKQAWSALFHCEWRVLVSMQQSHNASQLVGNVERVAEGVDRAINGIAGSVTLIAIAMTSMLVSPRVTLGAIVGGVVVLWAFKSLRRRARRLGEELSETYNSFSAELYKWLRALRIIKSFGWEDLVARRIAAELGRFREAEIEFQRGLGWGQIGLQGSSALLLAFIVWWAVAQWHAAPVSILPVVALCARALPLIGVLQDDWQAWAHAQPAFRETQKIIRNAGAAREPDLPVSSTPLQPPIEVRSVTVSWDERASPALSNVDLSIAEVGIVALSGPSGAGKSTLADVVGGLLRPDSGVITVGGVTLSADLRRGWRRRVAYVQQEAVLFAGTIGENLRWAAPDASDEQLWEALESASAGFVRKMKHGLDTPVGEDGRHLSGGERQRLALARSLLRDPALLILDEPTSALDEESEEAIKEVLKRLKKKVAILLISHRKRLLDVADVVVNLEAGRVTKVRLPRSSR